MRFVAVVEVASLAPGLERASLIEASYAASRSGLVALLVDGPVSPMLVETLDRLVATDRRVHGVVYRDLATLTGSEDVDGDTLFIGSSSPVRAAATAVEARWIDADGGIPALQRMAHENLMARKMSRTRSATCRTSVAQAVDSAPLERPRRSA